MGGFRFTNVGGPTSASNYIRGSDVINNIPIFMIDAETSTDRISVSATYFTTASANAAPAGGTGILIQMGSNKGSAPVLYLNTGDGSPHSANVVLNNGDALYSGAIYSGGIYQFVFSSAESTWHLLNPTHLPATTDTPGIIEIATTAEVDTGTDSTRAVTPALLAHKFSADYATTATPGLIEIATTAEAEAGTNVSVAMTPAGVKAYVSSAIVSATPTSAGIVELGTTAEIVTGTADTVAMTPAALGGGRIYAFCFNRDLSVVSHNYAASAWTVASGNQNGEFVVTHGLDLSNPRNLIVNVTPDYATDPGFVNVAIYMETLSSSSFQMQTGNLSVLGTANVAYMHVLAIQVGD
jgi:hypothetical protein